MGSYSVKKSLTGKTTTRTLSPGLKLTALRKPPTPDNYPTYKAGFINCCCSFTALAHLTSYLHIDCSDCYQHTSTSFKYLLFVYVTSARTPTLFSFSIHHIHLCSIYFTDWWPGEKIFSQESLVLQVFTRTISLGASKDHHNVLQPTANMNFQESGVESTLKWSSRLLKYTVADHSEPLTVL